MNDNPVVAEPLLELSAARLELSDGSRLPELEASAHGQRIALIGAWSPFFRLLAGEVRLAGGRVRVAGATPQSAVLSGTVGLALSDPPLPRSWTAERYLTESGRLLGWSRSAAVLAARELLTRFELRHLTMRTLASLPIVERRALLIAHATLQNPPAVCMEGPLDRLEGDAAAYVAARLERAIEGRLAILHFPAPAPVGPERAFIDRADRVLLLVHGRVTAHRPVDAAPSARVLATVSRHAGAFRTELENRGLAVAPAGVLAALLPALASPEGAELARFLIDLPDAQDTRGVLEASRAAEAPLVELRPLEGLSAVH